MQDTLSAPVAVELPASIISAVNTLKRAHSANRYRVPILQNLLITCDGDEVTLRSTDLEITAQYTAALEEACEPFAVTVPVKALAEAVKGAKAITLTIPESGARVTVNVDGMAREFFTLPAEDFPPYPAPQGEIEGTITGSLAELQRALTLAGAFASDEPARGSVLMGTLLEGRKGRSVRAVATDGYRLVITDCPELARDRDFAIILPGALAPVLASVKQDKKNPFAFKAQSSSIATEITAGPWKIVARLVDGQYPGYQRMVPGYDPQAPRVIVNRKALITIANQAKNASGDRASLIKITTEKTASGGDTLRVTSNSDTNGAFSGAIQAEEHNPCFPTIAFNGKFLAEVCGALTSEMVMLVASGPLSPALIFDGDHNGTQTQALLMPLRP
ncbi:MAG: DNA polymerase III subunit beta [Vulcanimicrobiaceae bacterium]